MGTVGRIVSRPFGGGNYRLNSHKGNRLDAMANFATKGSVFNEVVHTAVAAPAIYGTAIDWMEHGPQLQGRLGLIAFNMGLVAVQRYNRARTIKAMDRSLQHGSEFSPDYENWLGIDSRAIDNLGESQTSLTDVQQFPQTLPLNNIIQHADGAQVSQHTQAV